MKIFLQDSKTRRYCGKRSKWTGDETEAFNFPSCPQALAYGRDRGLAQIEVVMKLSADEAYGIPIDSKDAAPNWRGY